MTEKELSIKIYQAKKWIPEGCKWYLTDAATLFDKRTDPSVRIAPKYTLEFILEKLPRYVDEGLLELSTKQGEYRNGWVALYTDEDGNPTGIEGCAPTPLQAALSLLWNLIEEGVV